MHISQEVKGVIMRNLCGTIFYIKTNVLQDFYKCTFKWLRPSLSLIISLTPLGWRISKTEFGEGRMKLNIFSLKTEILGSKLFHSKIADRKKEFLKKLCFVLIRGILLSVLVVYDVHLIGMRWKRYFGCSFLKTL